MVEMLGDERIAPGEFSLDKVTGNAREKARVSALHTLPDDYIFAANVENFVARRILEEIGLPGGRASVEHHKLFTQSIYSTELSTRLCMNYQYSQVEKFLNGLEAIVQHAIRPYKQKEPDVLAR